MCIRLFSIAKVLVIVGGFVSGLTATAQTSNSNQDLATGADTLSGLNKLNHIIVLLQENRSFDQYFGAMRKYWADNSYPDESFDGLPQFNPKSGIKPLYKPPPYNLGCDPADPPPQDCRVDSNSPKIFSFELTTECTENTSPSWNESHFDWDLNDPTGLAAAKENGFVWTAAHDARNQQPMFYVASDGIPTLGGDDFDEILAELALTTSGISSEEQESLSAAEWFTLLEECREKKEALNANTRKVTIDLERVRPNWHEVSLAANVFYERCRPLIESTREVVNKLLAEHPERPIDTLYVTGGGSELPPVARILREEFGRRVRRSAYMRSATAIGLAIRADAQSGFVLRDQFMRNFGLWRETDEGRGIAFDLVFARGTALPGPKQPPLRRARSYRPAHNVGHFRYLECARLAGDGRPVGEITDWDDIRFPFDLDLQDRADLASVPVVRTPRTKNFVIEETYTCDSSGNLAVVISNKSTGYEKTFRLGRWSARQAKMSPGRARAHRA